MISAFIIVFFNFNNIIIIVNNILVKYVMNNNNDGNMNKGKGNENNSNNNINYYENDQCTFKSAKIKILVQQGELIVLLVYLNKVKKNSNLFTFYLK